MWTTLPHSTKCSFIIEVKKEGDGYNHCWVGRGLVLAFGDIPLW